MKQQIQSLKGFRDILPEDAKKREWLKNRLIEIFELWGYVPLETPTLEPLELFEGEIGEEEKLFFKFKDSGGRDVALRYDQTVPACRAVGNYYNEFVMPFKRYQIQPAYRAEKPQKGRYREFLQCDADIFGVKSPYADAETIALSLDIYRRLGFKQACVYINDRALMKDIPYKAIVCIDKLDKVGEDGVIEEMVKRGIEKEKANEYFDYAKNIKPNETIKIILRYLRDCGFDDGWYKFDPTIARSFSYSDGPIWEVKIPEYGNSSVLGGERYDGLATKLSGREMSGTGFGLGFDRTLEAMDALSLFPDIEIAEDVLVVSFSENEFSYATQMGNVLREAGVSVSVYPQPGEKLAKQFKYANRKNIPWVIVIGEDEVTKGMVTLKSMESGEQMTIDMDAAIEKILSCMACSSEDCARM